MGDFRHLPDEGMGLPTSLLHAGVPGVVGTLWTVDDQSTQVLMTRFYRLLLGDAGEDEGPLPPPEAVRKAQLWLRNVTQRRTGCLSQGGARGPTRGGADRLARRPPQGPVGFSLSNTGACPFGRRPYYWAAFICVGV